MISWCNGFIEETGLDSADSKSILKKYIEEGKLYLWENNKEIVSMAGWSGRTPNGIRINFVYTPKEHRGKGYASACTSGLCYHLLKTGHKKCFIFADQQNTTANSIYKKIGFDLIWRSC